MASYQRRRRLLSDKQIVELYASGLSALDVAASAGINWSKVLELVRASGGTVRPRGVQSPGLPEGVTEADICRRYREGESGNAIAAATGVGRSQVYKILDRNGVPLRDHARCSKYLAPQTFGPKR